MENITFKQLSDKYLAWCKIHRAPRSVEWYEGHINNFLRFLGDNSSVPATDLKPYHVAEWVDSQPTWGDTYKGGAIISIKRVYNWAEELGYVLSNPIKKLKKPTAKRREIYMQPGDFEQILSMLSNNDPFKDLLQFVWHTGCRPQEVRHIEPRHVDLVHERIVFPAEESKGKRSKRVIYMQGIALEIIKRLMADDRESKLFLNNRGTPWTKYAVCNRFHRLSKATGKRMFCYAARHGFATRKLTHGHDHLTVAALMGHTDGSMLAKVYSHVDQDTAHLKRALAD
jgi:integrase